MSDDQDPEIQPKSTTISDAQTINIYSLFVNNRPDQRVVQGSIEVRYRTEIIDIVVYLDLSELN